ncbi:polysaccharide deacetylase family protein [Parabacteroides distasonis]|uniref:polysaccharide deacetylase family protein n=1 Tax=Parabacteroides distasonis TaxID=823 RepID=UPI0018AC42B7|nr:polysaccharide deacetylase family protein [Parabacteroides distasonis]
MNILTFDTEEWYIEKHFKGGRKENYRQFDELLEWILDSLEKNNIKATFFCVGQLAVEFPDVLRRIADAGHEIGSHSNRHLWVNKMTPEEFAEDTRIALEEIENLIGEKVRSFRAPAFSIGKDNDWAFDILAENGIERDCSVFPASRDFGGFPQFSSSVPTLISKGTCTLKEFPICPASQMGKRIAFSGGGYFRLVPLWLQKHFMERMDYVMFYFHISDLIEQNSQFMTEAEFEEYFKEPGTLKNRMTRYVKTNIGKGGARDKLDFLLKRYLFCDVKQAVKEINWSNQPLVEL